MVVRNGAFTTANNSAVQPSKVGSQTTTMRSGPDRSTKLRFAASVVVGAVFAIFLHAVVGSFVVDTNELSYGLLGRTLGAEVVASIWALFAFAGSAFVFYRYHARIHSTGLGKGLRYGSAIALLWLVGMLEGVALFGNPILNEFLIGLSDAIPVMVMSILLGVFVFRPEYVVGSQMGHVRSIPILATIALVFLAGRYVGYFSGLISSGHQDQPVLTFIWTLLMGLSVGVALLLLWNAVHASSIIRTAARFGIWIFGVNWFVFMIFIPLLFEGVFVDIMIRVALDIAMVVLGGYLALRLWHRDQEPAG